MPLTCEVVTPEATAMTRTTEIVVVPLFDGELAIMPLHAPLIGRLGAGELRFGHGDAAERYFIEGGFVQVRTDRVAILTQTVTRLADLDPAAIRAELATLTATPAKDPAGRADLDRRISRARTRLRVAEGTRTAAAH